MDRITDFVGRVASTCQRRC